MTTEEQRIAIAEVCGWTTHNGLKNTNLWVKSDPRKHKDDVIISELPYYLNNLNNMHEAEKILSDKGELVIQCYLDNLCIATNGELAEMDGSYKEVWAMCYATASQRAEAFLRTLNLWKE